jgi:hypothetical protein
MYGKSKSMGTDVMKYVKLTAKSDTWFKEGTEVFDYDCHPPEDSRRLTLDSYNNWKSSNSILVRGIRITENAEAENSVVGEKRWDGEYCSIDEFDVEIVDDLK